MKAGWIFSLNLGDGSWENPNRPGLPEGIGGETTIPGQIVRLTGPGASPHRHLLIGGWAQADENLVGEVGEGHYHYVIKVGDTYHQTTQGAQVHTHTLNIGVNGLLIPDFYLLFWGGTDADAATIIASPTCWIIVQAQVTQENGVWVVGDLDNMVWTQEERDTWEARILNVLGVILPSEVDRGRYLLEFTRNVLLIPTHSDERSFRMGSL